MGRPGDEPEHPQDEVSLALGRLLVELGEKIQRLMPHRPRPRPRRRDE